MRSEALRGSVTQRALGAAARREVGATDAESVT